MLRVRARVFSRCDTDVGGRGGEFHSIFRDRVVLGAYFVYIGPSRCSLSSIVVESLLFHGEAIHL